MSEKFMNALKAMLAVNTVLRLFYKEAYETNCLVN